MARSLLCAQLPDAVALAAGLAVFELAAGLAVFELPVVAPEIVVSAMWHPRLDAEPADRWLHETVTAVCRDLLDR